MSNEKTHKIILNKNDCNENKMNEQNEHGDRMAEERREK